MARLDTINSGIDERLLAGELARQKQADREGEPQEASQEASLRERQLAARQAQAKQKEKKEGEEAVGTGDTFKSRIKDRILNAIPFYNSYRVLKSFFGSKKIKFDILDIGILAFTNIELALVIFGALAIFILVAYIYNDPLGAVQTLGPGVIYDTIKALF